MSQRPAEPILVAAAVIRDADGRLLLARRPADRHLGGLWEFPGGKVHAGEHPERALERELAEELALAVAVGEPITFAVHDEPGRQVVLLFYAASILDGPPRPMEGQEIAWVAPDRLREYPVPPADAALVRLLAAGG